MRRPLLFCSLLVVAAMVAPAAPRPMPVTGEARLLAQQAFTVLPHNTYQVGSRTFGPVNVPAGLSRFTLSFDRTEWLDENVKIAVSLDLSLDGGVTWNPHPDVGPFPVGMEAEGGLALDKFGNPVFESTLSSSLAQPGSNQRRVRGSLIITGGPLTTTATLTVE